MDILRGFKIFPVFLVILVSLVFLITFPHYGYCDEWVKAGSYEDYTQYYKSSSVKIDNKEFIITVLVKHILSEKGINKFLNHFEGVKKQKYFDVNYVLIPTLFNYNTNSYNIKGSTYCSKSGNVLFSFDYNKWEDIPPKSISDILLNQLLKDYNIQR
jgi:hypothetical protein